MKVASRSCSIIFKKPGKRRVGDKRDIAREQCHLCLSRSGDNLSADSGGEEP